MHKFVVHDLVKMLNCGDKFKLLPNREATTELHHHRNGSLSHSCNILLCIQKLGTSVSITTHGDVTALAAIPAQYASRPQRAARRTVPRVLPAATDSPQT